MYTGRGPNEEGLCVSRVAGTDVRGLGSQEAGLVTNPMREPNDSAVLAPQELGLVTTSS